MSLARSASRDGQHADTAAHIAWWADREDFPGTSGHIALLTACPARWITGTTPTGETTAATWRRWFATDGDDTATLLDLLTHASTRTPLAGSRRDL
jgi:hypothetical protein